MRQANDFRIGNIVRLGDRYHEIAFHDLDTEHSPVQITPDLLIKAGFEREGDKGLVLRIGKRWEWHYAYPHFVELYHVGMLTAVSYRWLHQLQNMHYLITGEELNVVL